MTQPDPSAQSGAPDQTGAQSGAAGGDGTTSTTDAGAQSGTTTTTTTDSGTVSRDEFERVIGQFRTQIQAADKKRNDAETQLQAIKDKDLPEMERLKRDAEAHKAEAERLREQAKQNAVQLAFLKENTVKWVDAGAALKLVDMTDVVVNDDGTVTGLKVAMEKLAKAMPFLVDKGTAAPDGNAANASNANPGAAGAPPMNGRTGSNQTDTNALANRIPALASRPRPRRS